VDLEQLEKQNDPDNHKLEYHPPPPKLETGEKVGMSIADKERKMREEKILAETIVMR